MKKKSKLLLVLLTVVCLAVAAFGLTACGDKPEGDDGDKTVVIKVGNTVIGDVTADGVTFDVEGEVGTYYNVYAKTTQNGTLKNDNGVIIKVDGDEGLGTAGGPCEFQYATGLKLNFAGNNKTVEAVTVVMEKVQTSVVTPPTTTTYTLTTEAPVELESLTGTVEVKFNTVAGKSYTVTAYNSDGEIYNDILIGKASKPGSDEFDGEDGEISISLRSQSGTATNVTITLTVTDSGDEYPALTIGENTVSEVPAFYVLEISEAGLYTFTGTAAGDVEDFTDVVIGTGITSGMGGADIADALWPESGSNDITYELSAGKYYVMVQVTGTLTIAKA